MITNALRTLAAVVLPLCTTGAGNAFPQQTIADQTKRLGVYVQTETGLTEIRAYGVETHNTLNETMTFAFSGEIPQIPTAIGFIFNLPDSPVAEAKVYLLPDVKAARWHYFNPSEPSDPQPLSSGIERVSDGVYKVAPDSMPANAAGYLTLRVRMPLGAPDRMYAVKLKAAATPSSGIQAQTVNPTTAASGSRLVKPPESADVWTDSDTGLTWASKDNGSNVTQRQALDYCKNLSVAGFRDWRLPEIAEVAGLYDSWSHKIYRQNLPTKFTSSTVASSLPRLGDGVPHRETARGRRGYSALLME